MDGYPTVHHALAALHCKTTAALRAVRRLATYLKPPREQAQDRQDGDGGGSGE